MADSGDRRLGDYELLELLGDGAQGRIYRARCVRSTSARVPAGTVVSLKVLRHSEEGQAGRKGYVRQIDHMLELAHPNIVRYLDSFVYRDEWGNDLRCLVMELLEGEDLHHCVQRHPSGLPWERVQSIFSQCIAALDYAAGRGVAHRDIKSSNIYLLPDGTVKVTDFGLAHTEGKTVTTQAGSKGTFDFMAPDFLEADEGFCGDAVSDIFSLGVCFYEALTGKLPYVTGREPGLMGYVNRWQSGDPFEPEITPRIFRVLTDAAISFTRKCLHRDRSLRYQSFSEMGEGLARVQRRHLDTAGGRYLFEDFLGKGGFGEVFRARREQDGRILSIKHLFPSHDPVRFLREARLLREHPHPNLVAYEDFVKVERLEGDDYYLIMEFLEGMPHWSLRSRVRQEGALDVASVVRLFCAYLDALEYLHHAHRKPVVHRDISPANLYAPPWDPSLPEERRPKIFDLGIARSDKTQTGGSVPGNPEYMPPEFVLDPDFRGSPQSDIYNLGLCLYEALCGRPAYARLPKSTTEMWTAMRDRAEGKLPIGFGEEVFRKFPMLADVVRRAVARNPRKRFGSAKEMKEALIDAAESDDESLDFEEDWATQTAVSGSEPLPSVVSGMPISRAREVARPRFSVRKIAAGVGIAFVAAALIAGGIFLRRALVKGPPPPIERVQEYRDAFEPTASYVGRGRQLFEDLLSQAETLPVPDGIGASLNAIREFWTKLPSRFDDAFCEALNAGNKTDAVAVLEQWRGCKVYLPFETINLTRHGKREASMVRRLEFVDTMAGLSKVTPSREHVTSLLEAIQTAAERGAFEEPGSSARTWWEKQSRRLKEFAAGLPDATANEMGKLLAGDKTLDEAESLAVWWTGFVSNGVLKAYFAAPALKHVRDTIGNGVARVVGQKRAEVVAAYDAGDEQRAKAGLEALAKLSVRYPALARAAGDALAQPARGIGKAQVRFLKKNLEGLPSRLTKANVSKAVDDLEGISRRFAAWRKEWQWDSGDVTELAEAGARRCSAIFDERAGPALAATGPAGKSARAEATALLSEFASSVPDDFGAKALSAKLDKLRLLVERDADFVEDVQRALVLLGELLKTAKAPDPASWKNGLRKWESQQFKEGVRADPSVVGKAHEIGEQLAQSARAAIAACERLDVLNVVREAVAKAVDVGVLDGAARDGLEALALSRETVLKLRGLGGKLASATPADWKEALTRWAEMRVPAPVRREPSVDRAWKGLESAFTNSVSTFIASLSDEPSVTLLEGILGGDAARNVISEQMLKQVGSRLADAKAVLGGIAAVVRIRGGIKAGQPETWRKAIAETTPYLKTTAYRESAGLRDACGKIATSIAEQLRSHLAMSGEPSARMAALQAVSEIATSAREAGLLDGKTCDELCATAAATGLGLVRAPVRENAPATWQTAITEATTLRPVVARSSDPETRKLYAALTGELLGYLKQYALQREPLDRRAARLQEAKTLLASAESSRFFAPEAIAETKKGVSDQLGTFILRVVNASTEDAKAVVGGSSVSVVPAGKQVDLKVPANGGNTAVVLAVSPAYASQSAEFTATAGGAHSVRVSGWRPKVRGVLLTAVEGVEDLSVRYRRRGESGDYVLLDAHSKLTPGEEYEVVYSRPGYDVQTHLLSPKPSVEPVALPAPETWTEKMAIRQLKQLEKALADGDAAAAEAILAALKREALQEWEPYAKRYDAAKAKYRELVHGAWQGTFDTAVKKWKEEAWKEASSQFAALASSMEGPQWERQREICELNRLTADVMRGAGDIRRARVKHMVDHCVAHRLVVPPDKKSSFDKMVHQGRDYQRTPTSMIRIADMGLENSIKELGPLPLPE